VDLVAIRRSVVATKNVTKATVSAVAELENGNITSQIAGIKRTNGKSPGILGNRRSLKTA
jgi:hypothetical protein